MIAGLLHLVREELRPAPGRLRAAARLLAALLVGSLLVLGFHLPHGHWMAITVLVVSLSNAGASLEKALQRMLGTAAAGAVAIFALAAFSDQPWFLVPLVGALCSFGLFLSRTTTAPYAGLLFGITVAILLPELDSPDAAVGNALWRVLMIVFGSLLGAAAQLWLWPDDPEDLLFEDLAAQLARAEGMLRGALAGGAVGPHAALTASRLGHQLDLLANAEARHRALRRRHDELVALALEVDRLVGAALWLERSRGGAPPAVAARRLATAADACARIAAGLRERRSPAPGPDPAPPPVDEAVGGVPPALLPALLEIERAAGAVGARAARLSLAETHAPSRLDAPARRPFFTPAFSARNREALRFALPAGLGASLCFVLVHALAWPGIATCLATCVICSQASLGASVQKGLLRLAGAVAGALLGGALVVLAMPNLESIGVLLALLALGFGAAAWVAVGGPRIAYAGIQLGFAFSMLAVDAFAPTTDLVAGRDRVLGILIGIAVMGLLESLIGPRRAATAMRAHLVPVLRRLGELSQSCLGGATERLASSTRGLRVAAYRELGAVVQLADEARAEPGARAPEAEDDRAALLRVAADAQELLIALLALARHRVDVDLHGALGPAIAPPLRALALAVGDALEAAARRVEGSGAPRLPDLAGALARAEESARAGAAALRAVGASPATLAQLEARLALYRELLPRLAGLARGVEALRPAGAPARAAEPSLAGGG